MGRLIHVPRAAACRSDLTVSVGDALLFTAVGVRVRSDADAVTIVGPFAPGVIGDDGHVLAPAGPPNAVMVIAKQAGRAAIDVISGDPWHLASRATGNWRRSAVSRSSKGVMKKAKLMRGRFTRRAISAGS